MADNTLLFLALAFGTLLFFILIFSYLSNNEYFMFFVNALLSTTNGFFKTVIDSVTGVGSGLIKFLLFAH